MSALDGKMPPSVPQAVDVKAQFQAKLTKQASEQVAQNTAGAKIDKPATTDKKTVNPADKKNVGQPAKFGQFTVGTPAIKPKGNVFGADTVRPTRDTAPSERSADFTPSLTDKAAREHTEAVAKAAGPELVRQAGGPEAIERAAVESGTTTSDLRGNESVNGETVNVAPQQGAPESVDKTIEAMKKAVKKNQTETMAKEDDNINTATTNNEAE